MIHVDFSTFVLIYLFFFMGNTLAVWLFYGWRDRFTSQNLSSSEVFRCTICTHVYLKEKEQTISRCPRCHSLN